LFYGMGGIQCFFNILGARTGNLAKSLARDGGNVFKVLAVNGGYPLTADVVVVFFLKGKSDVNTVLVYIGNFHGLSPFGLMELLFLYAFWPENIAAALNLI